MQRTHFKAKEAIGFLTAFDFCSAVLNIKLINLTIAKIRDPSAKEPKLLVKERVNDLKAGEPLL